MSQPWDHAGEVENIASSMNDVLSGRRSSFINRRRGAVKAFGLSRIALNPRFSESFDSTSPAFNVGHRDPSSWNASPNSNALGLGLEFYVVFRYCVPICISILLYINIDMLFIPQILSTNSHSIQPQTLYKSIVYESRFRWKPLNS